MLIIVFIIFILFIVVCLFYNGDNSGDYGEDVISSYLKRIMDKYDFDIYRNIYIKMYNGKYTELDFVIVSSKCLFVIECKNYQGKVEGDIDEHDWIHDVYGDVHTFYNPVMQNRGHISSLLSYLKKYIDAYLSIHSLIVFADNCDIREVDIHNERLDIVNLWEMNEVIDYTMIHETHSIKKKDINKINRLLDACLDYDGDKRKQHLEYVHSKKRVGF